MARPKNKPVAKHVKRKYVRKAKLKLNPNANYTWANKGGEPIYIGGQGDAGIKVPSDSTVMGGSLGGFASEGIDYYQTKYHVAELQRQFPGVWIRKDGAFRAEEYGVRWTPGDGLPSVNYDGDRKFYGPRGVSREAREDGITRDGMVMFDSIDFNRRGAELTLSQLRALVGYVSEVAGYV